ncbi:unnamed protein product [Phytophthora fragariaefolia]|uniref:Unnamed protein product n=1 Tax=Phytophthora fragariaefolia TaxID=1490495 RepID=A0A9W7CS83_9STRA|nr:unnamed protein product [Phytophthora fragariaefolia]
MARSRRNYATERPNPHGTASRVRCRRCHAGCSAKIFVVATLLAVLWAPLVTSSSALEPIISQDQEPSEHSYVAGSQLVTWWGQRGDVEDAIAQLGGVQQCPEAVNARVDREFLQDAALGPCRQSAAGYDVKQLLQPSAVVLVPSQEQTAKLCSSDECAAWIKQAVDAAWLPDCRYRQSLASVRSLAETLLRIREDLVATTGVDAAAIAPNASLFREFFQLNQLVNLWSSRQGMVNDVGAPVMEVARHLENFSLMGSSDSPELSTAVEPLASSGATGSAIHTRGSSSSSSPSNANSASASGSSNSASSPDSPGSASNSNSVGDFPSGSDFNSSDTAGFTSSGIGPHASSTATTRELTPAYAYVVGAWVLFNGSYFFLMRRK